MIRVCKELGLFPRILSPYIQPCWVGVNREFDSMNSVCHAVGMYIASLDGTI